MANLFLLQLLNGLQYGLLLFLIAAAGGSIGSILGMFAFRHKTRHLSFRLGLPAILALQCATAYLLWRMMQGR